MAGLVTADRVKEPYYRACRPQTAKSRRSLTGDLQSSLRIHWA